MNDVQQALLEQIVASNKKTNDKIRTSRRSFLLKSGAALALWSGMGIGATYKVREMIAKSNPPNVVIFLVDSLRSDYLTEAYTPYLNKLAKESILFENAYSTDCWTVPAVASLFTGDMSTKHKVLLYRKSDDTYPINPLRKQYGTLFENLGSKGYRNFGISANHYINENNGFTQGFHKYEVIGRDAYLNARDANDKMLNLISNEGNDRFSSYIHYFDVHSPYGVSDKNREECEKILNNEFMKQFLTKQNIPDLEQKMKTLIEWYKMSVAYADEQIGIFIEELKTLGQYENTLIIVTSDHGDAFGEDGKIWHGWSVNDPVIRVPLLIKMPYSKKAGINTNFVQLNDIYPFISDLCFAPYESEMIDGQDILKANHPISVERNKFLGYDLPKDPLKQLYIHERRTIFLDLTEKHEKWTSDTPFKGGRISDLKGVDSSEALRAMGYL